MRLQGSLWLKLFGLGVWAVGLRMMTGLTDEAFLVQDLELLVLLLENSPQTMKEHIHTHTHTYIPTYIHTYIHTHTYIQT